MNAKKIFCVVFFIASFCKVIPGYSFHKTFKSPKENYDELVEEKDKLEILERSNFSIEEDENEEGKSKRTIPEDSCPRAIATAQVHVRFGKEPGENGKNDNEVQHQFYEKQSLMFDHFLYQQFLYYMFLNGGLFRQHVNWHPSRKIPDHRNFHYYPHHPSCYVPPNYMLPCEASHYYNPNPHFMNLIPKRNYCKTNNRIKKQIQNWEEIQNVPVKQLTKHELQLILKYLDNDGYEETKLPNEHNFQENKNENSMKLTLEESFPRSTAAISPLKRYQKRSVTENCKSSSIHQNGGVKVTNNLKLIAVNISEIW